MITLSSDFGSPYPAAMKGVILQETDARLVDVTHELPRQDVRSGAFWLTQVLPYFPPAVHCAVVDPGVGTDRAALAIRAGGHALVGPDNGVLLPAARELASESAIHVFEVSYENPESDTFHGRDVFAPAAAAVHEAGIEGFEAEAQFEPVEDYESLTFPEPRIEEDGAVGEAIAIDGFGNIISTIPGDVLADHFGSTVKASGLSSAVRRNYAAVEPEHRVVTVGSHGNVELAINEGRADEVFGIDAGDRVRLAW